MKPKTKKALALGYDGKTAPKVLAKAEGDFAEQLIELAKAEKVFLHEDQALLQALNHLQLGDSIPPELYLVIAELIAFVYLLEGKKPDGSALFE